MHVDLSAHLFCCFCLFLLLCLFVFGSVCLLCCAFVVAVLIEYIVGVSGGKLMSLRA